MNDVVISVENLSKRYRIGGNTAGYKTLRESMVEAFKRLNVRTFKRSNAETIWALRDISFEVKRGEVVGIIGRNGAGKSTLLKILSRITKPTEGRAVVRGRVGSLLEVGTGFHPELTGRENIYLNGAVLGMSRREIERKFDEIVDFAEVEQFLDTPTKHYSSGMYMRLAFAVAAHLEPVILLVDEVLAVGDAAFQKKCLGKMGEVVQEGRTVLFVSHNMATIQSLCRGVMLLDSGNLVKNGESNETISFYLGMHSNSKDSEVNLINRSRSDRSVGPFIEKAWILNGLGEKNNHIMMGDSCMICFKYKFNRHIRNPGFGFGVEDEFGRRIFSLNNYMVKMIIKNVGDLREGIACLRIPKISLLPGSYFITLSLVEDQNEWIDFVEQALLLNIEPSDVYGSGKIPERSQGVVYVPGQIILNSVNSYEKL